MGAMTYTRQQILDAVRKAWTDAASGNHGNPYAALSSVLLSLGLRDAIEVRDGVFVLKDEQKETLQ